MQASVVLSPSSRLSQSAASDSADTLPWLSTTNAGAVPDPKMESLVAVEDRLSNVTESGVAIAVGAVEPFDVIPPAEVPAHPGTDWA
ncbi:hypothetical protein JOQ06_009040 [Pogonophryne albipinna]|uniref:Uncharacterized protein n=1 Tax=Pogonophryne albipinna TaxID=1090488 RepID=A0AAD6BNN4_9TELE|nr:hypothetical protein JOQ06_009040 [Pogonophryne albipinna]